METWEERFALWVDGGYVLCMQSCNNFMHIGPVTHPNVTRLCCYHQRWWGQNWKNLLTIRWGTRTSSSRFADPRRFRCRWCCSLSPWSSNSTTKEQNLYQQGGDRNIGRVVWSRCVKLSWHHCVFWVQHQHQQCRLEGHPYDYSPVQLRSRSTSFPCFRSVSPTKERLPEKMCKIYMDSSDLTKD